MGYSFINIELKKLIEKLKCISYCNKKPKNTEATPNQLVNVNKDFSKGSIFARGTPL